MLLHLQLPHFFHTCEMHLSTGSERNVAAPIIFCHGASVNSIIIKRIDQKLKVRSKRSNLLVGGGWPPWILEHWQRPTKVSMISKWHRSTAHNGAKSAAGAYRVCLAAVLGRCYCPLEDHATNENKDEESTFTVKELSWSSVCIMLLS